MSAPEPREADTLAAVESFNEAFGRLDVDGVMDCMTDDRGHVRGVDLFRVRDGKIAEKLSYVKG